MHHRNPLSELPIVTPPPQADDIFTDATEAVAEIRRRYDAAVEFLRGHFARVMAGEAPARAPSASRP